MPTPTPTPEVQGFVYRSYGFVLRLDNEADIAATGWTESAATVGQGLLSFEYGGTNVLVLWVQKSGATPEGMLTDTYQTLRAAQPDITFAPITEGDITVDKRQGKFGGFAASDSSGTSVGGGLIGTWVCPGSNTAMALTVISANATTLQVRFSRLLQGIEC